jgi:single-stranded DNA-binding protein
MDLEQIQITGNVVADAIIKESTNGGFTSFSVAVNITKEQTNFYSAALSGDKLCQYIQKGKKVFIEGKLSLIQKTDNHGNPNIFRNISVNKIILM